GVVARGLYSEWSLILIDMTSIVNGSNGYTPDSQGNYFLNELVLSVTNPPVAGESVCFSYIMTFNKLEEALEVFEREDGYYRYDDMVNENFPNAVGRVCNHRTFPRKTDAQLWTVRSAEWREAPLRIIPLVSYSRGIPINTVVESAITRLLKRRFLNELSFTILPST
ncbi:MAG: hypothetical protein J6L83_06175, partial [Clostridia bacterium]|nr:hypothetical protein [Clostridia bacterium]